MVARLQLLAAEHPDRRDIERVGGAVTTLPSASTATAGCRRGRRSRRANRLHQLPQRQREPAFQLELAADGQGPAGDKSGQFELRGNAVRRPPRPLVSSGSSFLVNFSRWQNILFRCQANHTNAH